MDALVNHKPTIVRMTIDEMRPLGFESLVKQHWLEVSLDRETIPLDIDYDAYRAAANEGRFVAYGMMLNGVLRGYNGFFVLRHMHYRQTVHALNDGIYVEPHFRGLNGVRLILEAEKRLRVLGAAKIMYHSKEHIQFAAGARGGYGDSLDQIQDILDLEVEYGISLREQIATDITMGGLLVALGYSKIESIYAKLTGV